MLSARVLRRQPEDWMRAHSLLSLARALCALFHLQRCPVHRCKETVECFFPKARLQLPQECFAA